MAKIVIEVSDGVTNGDIIQNICSMWIVYHDTDIEVTVDKKVWNAPYKNAPYKVGKWIPVSERLPEKCGYYLCSLYYAVPPYHVFHPENDLYIHDVRVQKFDGKSFIASVKAWMPLPAPFEPQESEDKE